MSVVDSKLKSPAFWLWVGVINHSIVLVVILLGCVYSSFTCQGDSMKDALSLYAFTLFTPQLALEVILLMAIFLVSNSINQFRENWRVVLLFIITALLLTLYTTW